MNQSKVWKVGVLFGVLFLSGCGNQPNIKELMASRMEARSKGHESIQDVAIFKNMETCLFASHRAGSDFGALDRQLRLLDMDHPFRSNSLAETETAADAAEAECTDNLVEAAAITNPRGASSLAYLLIERGYAVSEKYSVIARKDDAALASVTF